jgi:hypothetical protein
MEVPAGISISFFVKATSGDRPTSSAEHEMKATSGDRSTSSAEHEMKATSGDRSTSSAKHEMKATSGDRPTSSAKREMKARYCSGAAVSGMTQTEGWDTLARMGNHKRRQAN